MNKLIIHAISDLHGYKPQLPGGDLLIIAGDCTAWDEPHEWEEFADYLNKLEYKNIILVAGNHDVRLQQSGWGKYDVVKNFYPHIIYLKDEAIQILGLKIYGTPWTHTFVGQNPTSKAFAVPYGETREKYNQIPLGLDILVCHGPPLGILDQAPSGRVGNMYLKDNIDRAKPKHVVFGHIHTCHGMQKEIDGVRYYNVAAVDDDYKLQNHGATEILVKC